MYWGNNLTKLGRREKFWFPQKFWFSMFQDSDFLCFRRILIILCLRRILIFFLCFRRILFFLFCMNWFFVLMNWKKFMNEISDFQKFVFSNFLIKKGNGKRPGRVQQTTPSNQQPSHLPAIHWSRKTSGGIQIPVRADHLLKFIFVSIHNFIRKKNNWIQI